MIKVFIGTEERQKVSTAVLKYSIISRTKDEVVFTEMKGLQTGLNIKMYTGFSFYRYLIPGLLEFKGRGLYLDTDIVFQDDISKLYNLEMPKPALARPRNSYSYYTSVMLLDSERLKHWGGLAAVANKGKDRYAEIMWGQGYVNKDFGPLDKNWNCLDSWGPSTKALHFTNVPTQPWTYSRHNHKNVWLRELKNALKSGFIMVSEVEANLKYLYPKILEDAYVS